MKRFKKGDIAKVVKTYEGDDVSLGQVVRISGGSGPWDYTVDGNDGVTDFVYDDQLVDASSKEKREFIYGVAIKKWGNRAQLEMAQEEATELALAVRAVIRGKDGSLEDLPGEIADVEIMIEQLKMMYPQLVKSVGYAKRTKIKRLKGRLDEGVFNG